MARKKNRETCRVCLETRLGGLIFDEVASDKPISSCQKRLDYLRWDEYFMAMAYLNAKRSKDPNTQVGACIVDGKKRIVANGYNGFPTGCSDDEFPWGKTSADPLENKYAYVCHAELNAVMNKNSADISGCIMYVTLFPCYECAKIIIQAGISEIVYAEDKSPDAWQWIASKRMLRSAGIDFSRYRRKDRKIEINI